MLGLRTQEKNEFNNFFRIVQSEAQKQDCIFFFDTQEGIERLVGNCECSNISGWLVPNSEAKEFEKEFIKFSDNEDWNKFSAWVTWHEENDNISVNIELLN